MRVLFLGNSHTYFNDMAASFTEFYEILTGENAEVTALMHPCKNFEWHMKEYYEVRFNLMYGNYDYCIMQQAAHPFQGEGTTIEDGKKLVALCEKTNTIPVFTVTWSEEFHPESQEPMIEVFEKLSIETGAKLAKVGQVWKIIRDNYPEIPLYWHDGEHASSYGSYLNACLLASLISGKSPIGLPSIGKDFLKEMNVAADAGIAIDNKLDVIEELNHAYCEKIQKVIHDVIF